MKYWIVFLFAFQTFGNNSMAQAFRWRDASILPSGIMQPYSKKNPQYTFKLDIPKKNLKHPKPSLSFSLLSYNCDKKVFEVQKFDSKWVKLSYETGFRDVIVGRLQFSEDVVKKVKTQYQNQKKCEDIVTPLWINVKTMDGGKVVHDGWLSFLVRKDDPEIKTNSGSEPYPSNLLSLEKSRAQNSFLIKNIGPFTYKNLKATEILDPSKGIEKTLVVGFNCPELKPNSTCAIQPKINYLPDGHEYSAVYLSTDTFETSVGYTIKKDFSKCPLLNEEIYKPAESLKKPKLVENLGGALGIQSMADRDSKNQTVNVEITQKGKSEKSSLAFYPMFGGDGYGMLPLFKHENTTISALIAMAGGLFMKLNGGLEPSAMIMPEPLKTYTWMMVDADNLPLMFENEWSYEGAQRYLISKWWFIGTDADRKSGQAKERPPLVGIVKFEGSDFDLKFGKNGFLEIPIKAATNRNGIRGFKVLSKDRFIGRIDGKLIYGTFSGELKEILDEPHKGWYRFLEFDDQVWQFTFPYDGNVKLSVVDLKELKIKSIVDLPLPGSFRIAKAHRLADGKVIVASGALSGSENPMMEVTLLRLNSDGKVDQSFGNAGLAKVKTGAKRDSAIKFDNAGKNLSVVYDLTRQQFDISNCK